MKSTAPTLALSASIAAIAASPALAADGVASPAITSTGGSIALLGIVLVGAGVLMLARTRGDATQDTEGADAPTAEAVAATRAPESADVERLLKLATSSDRQSHAAAEPADEPYHPEPGAKDTLQDRGGVLNSPRRVVVMSDEAAEPSIENDEVARQMLDALRAERARRDA